MNLSYTVKDCFLISIPTFVDDRGTISVLDKELPFQVQRIFWLYHINQNMYRGAHALYNSAEIIVAVHGSFIVDLDDSEDQVSIMLDSPDKGLIIRPGIWFRAHSYNDDGVSLIMAEDVYSRKAYISDYNEFIKLRNAKYNTLVI